MQKISPDNDPHPCCFCCCWCCEPLGAWEQTSVVFLVDHLRTSTKEVEFGQAKKKTMMLRLLLQKRKQNQQEELCQMPSSLTFPVFRCMTSVESISLFCRPPRPQTALQPGHKMLVFQTEKREWLLFMCFGCLLLVLWKQTDNY